MKCVTYNSIFIIFINLLIQIVLEALLKFKYDPQMISKARTFLFFIAASRMFQAVFECCRYFLYTLDYFYIFPSC